MAELMWLSQVDIPHPHAGHADFVVLRARFDQSLATFWSCGQPCRVGSS